MSPNKTKKSFSIIVLASGRGSNFKAIAEYIEKNKLSIQITKLITDNSKAPALSIASSLDIKNQTISPSSFKSKSAFFESLTKECLKEGPDLVVLAGFMRVLNSHFINAFSGKIINIHPSLLPSFPGLNPQEQALNAGVKFSGCTVHLVNEKIDSGKILAQAVVPVLENDTVETLEMRILAEEHKLLPEVIEKIASNKIAL